MAITPTDRGYAFIMTGAEGVDVAVAAARSNARPEGVYAMHYAVDSVEVGAGVDLVDGSKVRYTAKPVAVHAKDNVVYLLAEGSGLSGLAPRVP
jgi:hypothetical protein